MTDKLAGIRNPGTVYLNPSVPELIERAIAGGEGALAASGALEFDDAFRLMQRGPADLRGTAS